MSYSNDFMNNSQRHCLFGLRRGGGPLAPTVRFEINGFPIHSIAEEMNVNLFVTQDGA
jgi:hypothetical protein